MNKIQFHGQINELAIKQIDMVASLQNYLIADTITEIKVSDFDQASDSAEQYL